MLCPQSPILSAKLQSLDAKVFSGLAHSPTPIAPGLPASQMASSTYEANWNAEKVALSTGSCFSLIRPKSLSDRFEQHGLPSLDTGNSLDPQPPKNTYGKLSHALVNPLNLEPVDLEGMSQPTGLLLGKTQSKDCSMIFPQTFLFDITVISSRFALQAYSRLLWSDLVKSTGAELTLESHSAPGMKPASTLILKIRGRSFGTVTQIKEMLCWMNFEEVLTYPICLDGSTATRSEWKSKEAPFLSQQPASGSLRTCPRQLGIRNWMQQRIQHSNED